MAWRLITAHKMMDYRNKMGSHYLSSADHLAVKNNRFCVADGITRDTISDKIISVPKNLKELIDCLLTTPHLFNLKQVSRIVCHKFVDSNESDLKVLLSKINQLVTHLNRHLEVNYLGNDYYACVAAGGILTKENLHCFNIGDSNIIALNNNLDQLFMTKDDFNETCLKRDIIVGESIPDNKGWADPRIRKMYRSQYRNNVNAIHDGECLSYGAITGEAGAMNFIKTYDYSLDDAAYVICMTDGYLPYFKNPEMKEQLISSLNNDKKILLDRKINKNPEYGKERSLVLYKRI